MSPRPRSASDDQIRAAALRVIARDGPSRLTLAAVGEECGLAPATLVQRFGSRRGLMLAVAAAGARQVDAAFARARRAHASPLEALLAALCAVPGASGPPQAAAHHLAFLHAEPGDEEFHGHALARAMAVRAGVVALLRDAAAAVEVVPGDAEGLAQTVQTTWSGALATWAVFRAGTAEEWIRGEVEAVLEPFRTE